MHTIESLVTALQEQTELTEQLRQQAETLEAERDRLTATVDELQRRAGVRIFADAEKAAPQQHAQAAPDQAQGGEDWLGRALDLEKLAYRVESQTVRRAMESAALCLRLLGSRVTGHAQAALSEEEASKLMQAEHEAEQLRLKGIYPNIAGSHKVFEVSVFVESGCDASSGEFECAITKVVSGWVGKEDHRLVHEAIWEEVANLNLPSDGCVQLIVYESGEREDVFWNSYYRVHGPVADLASQKPAAAPASPHDVCRQIERNLRDEILRLHDAAAPAVQVQDAELPPQITVSRAGYDVWAERQRQVEQEGWTPGHDDEHDDGQMAVAAGYYALACGFPHERDIGYRGIVPQYWPWEPKWWKPSTARCNLVKAGALILAEIERLDRAALMKGQK